MRQVTFYFAFAVFVSIGRVASGQSIYVDMDGGFGGAEVGTGAPSSSFAGAAGVPGYWNQVQAGNGGPWQLRDADGELDTVSMSWTGSGASFGFNNPALTGDFRLLMADAEMVGAGGLRYEISGLAPGEYRVFTYACKPQGQALTSFITVPGSTQGTVAVTGPMPPNFFVAGVTHSIHDVNSLTGTIRIQAAEIQNSYVNGFQLLAVPEPATVFACAFGLAILIRRTRM